MRAVQLRVPQAELASAYTTAGRASKGLDVIQSAWARLNRSLEVVTYAMSSESLPLFLYGPHCGQGSLEGMLDPTALENASERSLPGYYLRGGSTEEHTEITESVDADLSGRQVLVTAEEMSELDNMMDALGDYARVMCVLRGGEMAYTYVGQDTLGLYVSEYCPLDYDGMD